MPTKSVTVDKIGQVELIRKRGLKSIRLRIDAHGAVKVSIPWLVPAQLAMEFVKSKQDWIVSQQQSIEPFSPYNGMRFGKNFSLYITELSPAYRSRIVGNKLSIAVMGRLNDSDRQQMAFIKKAIIRALKADGTACLEPRVAQLAVRHGIKYEVAKVKHLTGRWGSCDSRGSIALSLFLAQLPWELIDYVIIHELAHVENMNHSASFWQSVENMYPNHKVARKQLRSWQPRIYTQ